MHKFVYFQTLLQKEKQSGRGEVEEAGEEAEDDEEVYYDEEELEDVRMQNITSIDNQKWCFQNFLSKMEAYSEPCQTSKMECFVKIINIV